MGNCMKTKSTDIKQSQKQRQEPIKCHQPTEQDRMIANLKDLRDELYSKQQALYKQEEKSEQEIKQLLREKKKQRAKFAMQRKKLYDNYLTQIEQKYQFISGQIVQVEKTIMDKSLNEVMEQTNTFLKDIQKAMNLDVFSDAMEVDADLQQQEQQFNQLFEQYNVGNVDEEYEKYEAEILQNQLNQDDMNNNQVPFKPIEGYNQMEIEQAPRQQQQQEKQQEEEMLLN